MGSHLILFLFYILPQKFFFDLKFEPGNRPFFRPRFFIPRGGISSGIPYGVPFDSLSFLYLTPNTLFLISIYPGILAIFDPRDFLY